VKLKCHFEITINVHDLPSSTSSDSEDTDSSGGGSVDQYAKNGNNYSGNAGSPRELLSPTSPAPNYTSNSGDSDSEGEPPIKRRRESSPNQVEVPGEADSKYSTGEDSYSIISVSSEEGAETPNYNQDPQN